ncbi:MAG: SPOR domain-containing protein [Rhodocyclaceae bacterium]|nr:SPOR domain-containing protein [Rhodocyclaceae bacterium]
MRGLFFFLVLANLAFFAWSQGYLGGTEEGREPQKLATQLFPEKMQVSVPGATAAPAALAAAPAKGPGAAVACRLVEGLPQADAERLAASVVEKGEGMKATVTPVREPPTYWVHLPVLAARAAADKKAVELKPLGITEFKVLEQDDGFAVSLGLFRNEQSARDLLQSVQKKGAKSALITERETPATRASVEIQGPADWLGKHLAALLPAGTAALDCPAR